MKMTIAAGATAYSIRIAVPVANPPRGPNARRAKPYPAPATGSAEDSSARPSTMQVYMSAIRTVAISRPPQPPSASPKFQPAKSPEMTYATPRPASSTHPTCPCWSWRWSR
jgi:hypothetical protein